VKNATPSSSTRAGLRRRSAGFSLIELMVAVVIGLIGSIVIFQVFGIFEGQKRTTTSAGDAQQSGLLALVAIERELRMSGYGLSYVPLLGCNVVAYDSTNGGRDFTFPLLGVQISQGAGGAPDSIAMLYGSSNLIVAPGKLTFNSAVGALSNKIDTTYGYQVGDLVIIGQATKDCTMRQVTEVPPASGSGDQINHNPGPRYNKSGGSQVAYAFWDNTSQSGGRIYNMGPAPVYATYSVVNDQLMYQNLMVSAASTPVVDGIVQLKAEYGRDTDGDGDVDTWTATMPGTPTPTDWSRVIAVRLAVVARSAQPEKPNQTTFACDTTTAQPTWAGGSIDVSNGGAIADWGCYRYRVFETKVPIRNFIWSPQ
jgi:type IV pilus assembly protein PilW